MKINWGVRFKNPVWVIALLGGLFLIIQSVQYIFGVDWDYNDLMNRLITVITSIFALIGIIQDPTTANLNDSERVQKYIEPRKDE
ncbi:phage holin [Listeria ivanovii]|uniref:Putative holin n=1 Tax=Listeria ivanovii (strain ATCC BAA-678 / PAM 55) TaxID=881621 RepID=G2ZAD3_LISIP|nr:phage holin [Listeria ivanovii]AHI56163.1 holin [Listeria ivanovii WSLC3009]AIS65595.1 holin [Listeria ivanovii subsp. ivanovii]MBC1759515.1 phage holin [Listeria ivanovii]MBK3915595.1 phage holin [Listeria ivanovii subsp. ivanovii]MBK3922728.1 phage holin [Listeria ivanovii subsp. ivanovii]